MGILNLLMRTFTEQTSWSLPANQLESLLLLIGGSRGGIQTIGSTVKQVTLAGLRANGDENGSTTVCVHEH